MTKNSRFYIRFDMLFIIDVTRRDCRLGAFKVTLPFYLTPYYSESRERGEQQCWDQSFQKLKPERAQSGIM